MHRECVTFITKCIAIYISIFEILLNKILTNFHLLYNCLQEYHCVRERKSQHLK